jgi:uncharacterized protein
MDKTDILTFPNEQGARLFGILHSPVTTVIRDVGIVLLSPGIKSRVGPHRLYIRMAQAFARMGFPVLRFDFYGLGDSEGELRDCSHSDLHTEIQLGRYVQDANAAIDCIRTRTGVSRVIVGGLCGGALTGLLSGAENDNVAGLLALGIPVILDNQTTTSGETMTKGQRGRLRRGYVRKLLDLRSWIRLFTLKTDFGTLFRSLWNRPKNTRGKNQNDGVDGSTKSVASNLNPLFSPACFKFLKRGAPILFIFSGGDRLHWEFEEKFLAPNKEYLAPLRSRFEMHTIEDANHILSLPEWEKQMLVVASDWLSDFLDSPTRDDGVEAEPQNATPSGTV